jgi:conjugal transfer/type IV secretion protein DotA/TraY
MRTLRYFTLFLALCSGLTFAADAEDSAAQFDQTISDIVREIPDPDEDLALGWIRQIFGDIAFSAWNKSSTGYAETTILTEAIGYTNVVALLLGLVISGYVILAGIINSASTGKVMGGQWSSVWLPLRSAIAFGLILPVGALSAIQIFVLSLIVVGSNSGTFLWREVASKIVDGAGITAVVPSMGMDSSKKLLISLVCAESVYRQETETSSNGRQVQVMSIKANGAWQPIYGPLEDADITIPSNATRIAFGSLKNGCGTLDLADDLAEEGSEFKPYHLAALKAAAEVARKQLGIHIQKLAPVAHTLVSGVLQDGMGGAENIAAEFSNDTLSPVFEILWNGYATIYGNEMQRFTNELPAAITKASSGNPAIADAWKADITKGGWGGAGAWYFEMTRFESLNRTVIKEIISSIPTAGPPDFCYPMMGHFSDCANYELYAAADMSFGVDALHAAAIRLLSDSNAKNGSGEVQVAARQALIDIEQLDEGKASADETFAALGSVLTSQVMLSRGAQLGNWIGNDGMSGEVSSTDTSGMASPFRTVTGIGHALNLAAGIGWGVGLYTSVASGTAEGVADTVVGGLGAAPPAKGWARGLDYIVTTIMALIMLLVPMGFTLAFLIPFMPIIAWIRLLAAYLLTAIEAVVAAPLAVIMMATPEGEGIAGTRLERAIALMAAVILKPTLLVIGLLASLVLAYVSFAIVNQLFWQVAGNMTNFSPFEVVTILVIYTSLAFQVAKASIDIMHKLPDQILDWMASGAGGRSFGDHAEGAIEGGMGEVKQGANQITQTLTAKLASTRQLPRAKPAKEAAEDTTTTS